MKSDDPITIASSFPSYDFEPESASRAELHVVEEGVRNAPSILLIHGTAGSVAWWDPIVPALAEHSHVVRVDLAGHGQSPPARSYAVRTQADRVGAVVDALGIDAVTVVGHSSGGLIATALAEQRPGVVSAVVLVNTGPSPDANLAALASRSRMARRAPSRPSRA
jgi:pimeloyl-ACP methyl ester carboxylesterase